MTCHFSAGVCTVHVHSLRYGRFTLGVWTPQAGIQTEGKGWVTGRGIADCRLHSDAAMPRLFRTVRLAFSWPVRPRCGPVRSDGPELHQREEATTQGVVGDGVANSRAALAGRRHSDLRDDSTQHDSQCHRFGLDDSPPLAGAGHEGSKP